MSISPTPMNPMRALVVSAAVGLERNTEVYELATDLLYFDELERHRGTRDGSLAGVSPIDLLTAEDGEALARALRIVIVHRKLMEEAEAAQPERGLEASGAIELLPEAEDGLLLMLVAMTQKRTWLPGDVPADLVVKEAPHA